MTASYQTKHLAVVESTASDAYSTLGSFYGSAKGRALSYAPDFVSTVVGNMENICKPWLDFGSKTSMNLLLCADSGVDSGVNIVSSTASYSRKQAGRLVGDERMKPVDNFVSQAQGAMQTGVDTVKTKGVFGAMKEGAAYAMDTVKSAGTYAKSTVLDVNHTVGEGASSVKEKLDNVSATLYNKWLTPAVNNTAGVYMSVHDAVVKQRAYATAHSYTTKAASYVWSYHVVRMPFEFTQAHIYPLFEPVAGPFVKRFSPYTKDIKKHLEPQAEPVPVVDVVAKKADNGKVRARKAKQQAMEQVDSAVAQAQRAVQ